MLQKLKMRKTDFLTMDYLIKKNFELYSLSFSFLEIKTEYKLKKEAFKKEDLFSFSFNKNIIIS